MSGEQLHQLSGIAAILKYACPEIDEQSEEAFLGEAWEEEEEFVDDTEPDMGFEYETFE